MIERTEQEIMQNWKGDIDTPVVSICSITYNHEKFIAEALDSFLMQETDFPFEIIIDDDCSLDNTADIIRKYVAKYPTIIQANFREKNVGMMQNFIANIKRARGKYIALCEGDDYWTDPMKLQKQMEFLEENGDFSLIGSTAFQNNIEGETIGKPGVYDLNDILQRNFMLTLTSMFRATNFSNATIRLMENIKVGDWPLFTYLLKFGKAKVFDEPIGVYREHAGGIYSSLATYKTHMVVIECYLEFFKKDDIFSKEEKYYLLKGARNRLGELYVLDFEYDKDKVLNTLYDTKSFLTNFEYDVLKMLYHLNQWLFGRIAWRILQLDSRRKIEIILNNHYTMNGDREKHTEVSP